MKTKNDAVLLLTTIKLAERTNNLIYGAADAIYEDIELSRGHCAETIMINMFAISLVVNRKPQFTPEQARDAALERLSDAMDAVITDYHLYETKGSA